MLKLEKKNSTNTNKCAFFETTKYFHCTMNNILQFVPMKCYFKCQCWDPGSIEKRLGDANLEKIKNAQWPQNLFLYFNVHCKIYNLMYIYLSSAFDLFMLILRSLLVLYIKHSSNVTQYGCLSLTCTYIYSIYLFTFTKKNNKSVCVSSRNLL